MSSTRRRRENHRFRALGGELSEALLSPPGQRDQDPAPRQCQDVAIEGLLPTANAETAAPVPKGHSSPASIKVSYHG